MGDYLDANVGTMRCHTMPNMWNHSSCDHVVSEQDWELCEFAQTGISSCAYRPGPYSTHKEYNVAAFVRWYLEALEQ